jgi:rRNA maturation protein Nop10
MTKNIWQEREQALENQYFVKKEHELIDKLKEVNRETLARELSKNRCPKCGEQIVPMTFRGVPLDKCPGCGGVWLGPKDLQILSAKDHRTWFEKWFKNENNEE